MSSARAVTGPLAGKRLRAIVHVDAFWFAWAAFHPATGIYGAPRHPSKP
ncbi:MAG: DUF3179 domain-containing (seleno)protein [Candidatus Rokuibacteriota bacterium]